NERLKTGNWDCLDTALLKWFSNAHERSVVISGEVLKIWAAESAHKITVFNTTSDWLDQIQERCGIHFRSVYGESNSANNKAIKDGDIKPKSMLQNYSADDIYNANETGLFLRMLPD
ncbi:TIGD6-like protein, partial [Mya arenaria]